MREKNGNDGNEKNGFDANARAGWVAVRSVEAGEWIREPIADAKSRVEMTRGSARSPRGKRRSSR